MKDVVLGRYKVTGPEPYQKLRHSLKICNDLQQTGAKKTIDSMAVLCYTDVTANGNANITEPSLTTRVTMSDVARQAGVSLMTVSRVINHKGDVNPETRKRILKVIKELGYRPSAIARSLATQETRTIGLVIPDVSNPFFADITRGIEQLAYAEGYHVFLCNTEEDPGRELTLIQSLEEKWVDGLILCSSRLDESVLTDLLARLPAVVLINRLMHNGDYGSIQSVRVDDESGASIAVSHLIRSGARRIGFLAGPPASFSGQGRKTGYFNTMDAAGFTVNPGWVVNCQPTVEGGHQATLKLLEQHTELEALYCYNDLVAVGALQACKELKRRIPDDLMVVGNDDIPLAALVSPTLTTCRVPRRDLGALAVKALLDRLKDCPDDCQQIVLQPELVVRQSAP